MTGLSRDKIINELNKAGIADYNVQFFEKIESTNTYVMENYKDIAGNVDMIIANEQTGGKGRLGRTYESAKDEGIYMTLVLKPQICPQKAVNITLVSALAISRAFDELGIKTKVKWPNDIICDKKKICGILTEMKNQGSEILCIAVGIGINVNQKDFSKELENKATSIYLQTGSFYERAEIIAACVKHFNGLYKEFLEHENLEFMVDEYNEKLINIDKEIIIEKNGIKESAILLGIDNNGILKILVDGKEEKLISGEIQVRGLLGYV